jgi:hypothetical protein
MRTLVWLLLLANLTLLGYTKLDSLSSGEGNRLSQQVQPDKITLLSPQQVAALGPTKVSALADVCVEWGPFSDADKARALSALDPLDLSRLISQKKVEVVANYWVFIPPAGNRAAADRRIEELKALGVKELLLIDGGPQRFAISLGVSQTEAGAQARLDSLLAQGVKTAKVAARTQALMQTDLVIRDPPAVAVARVKDLQGTFPGSDIKIGTCDKAA